MSKIEVLVTTMHQTGFEKYLQMNLQTDAVIANQTNRNFYEEKVINGHMVKLVSTDGRGTSRNRNIALALSSGDLLMFSDDDLKFVDGYEKMVIEEFEKHPEADAIQFSLNVISISETKKTDKNGRKPVKKEFHRVNRHDLGGAGVCGVVVKKEVIQRKSLFFNESFGPGTKNYCGEDTIFLQEMIKKRVRVFSSPVVIADIDKSESTWFEGYTERYFETGGMVIGTIYPILSYLIVLRSAFMFFKKDNVNFSLLNILRCYYRGIRNHV